MKRLFILAMVGLSLTASVQCSEIIEYMDIEQTSGTTTSPHFHEVCPGVFAGKAIAAKFTLEDEHVNKYFLAKEIDKEIPGDIIQYIMSFYCLLYREVHFGREKVTKENMIWWKKYAQITSRLLDDRGLLYSWPLVFKNGEEISHEQVKHVTGFTEDEHNSFMIQFKSYTQENILEVRNNRGTVKQCAAGICGFQNDEIKGDNNFYIAYASKKPITGEFFSHNKYPDCFASFADNKSYLKQYIESFKDLLMVMSFKSDLPNSYTIPGIFKNPISCIQDGKKYDDLFMKLLAYSAVVNQDKKFMNINPVYFEFDILVNVNGWNPGDFRIKEKDFCKYTTKKLNNVRWQNPNCQIKTSSLARLF